MQKIDVALSRAKAGLERVLLIAYYEPRSVPSIVENIATLQHLSKYPISVLNLAEHRADHSYFKLPPALNLDYYDAIIIHNTVACNVDNLLSLDTLTKLKFKDYAGAKIILRQDEHYRFAEFARFANEAEFDCVFSVMPEAEVPKTYGAHLPRLQVRHMLTSYVTPEMRRRFDTDAARPIDIGYRGSVMPLSFGKLCYQKRKIGDDVNRLLAGCPLNLDISSRPEDRFGGEAWFRFLASCKAVLGVESGTETFDLDGTLEEACRGIERQLGPDDGSDLYANRYLEALSPFQGKVEYFTISPRHFEAIAMGTIQVLFPGAYTHRMKAHRHFFELRVDYANLDEAVDLITDDARRSAMASAAFEEVILDKRNWIETFASEIDDGIAACLDAKGRRRKTLCSSSVKAKNVLVMHADQFGLDPRRDRWYAANSPSGVRFHQLGVVAAGAHPLTERGTDNSLILNVPQAQWEAGCLDTFVAQTAGNEGASVALREVYFIAYALNLSDSHLFRIYAMPQATEFVDRFRFCLAYILRTAATLVTAGAQLSGVHCIVAINFPSLIPALILKAILGVPVIYEALEYWPEANANQGEFANAFFLELERRLIKFADRCGTTSPALAELMSEKLGTPFYAVPNCVPKSEIALCRSPSPIARAPGERVRFLFQGNLAPNCGLEQLIRAWSQVDGRAILVLRGPESPFRNGLVKLAQDLGLEGGRIVFPDAVAVDDFVAALRKNGDVGIVPYLPIGTNYANCSPTELCQYMAVGLPVLANATNSVRTVLEESRCGLATDFTNVSALRNAIHRLCDDEFRKACADRSAEYFSRTYNWEEVSRPFYDAVMKALGSPPACELSLSKPFIPSQHPVHVDDVKDERPDGDSIAQAVNRFVSFLVESELVGTHTSKQQLATWLAETGLLDVELYLAQNDDVRAAGARPDHHYVYHGAREGRHSRRF